MTQLEQYSIFERTLIMFVKQLEFFLSSEGYSLGLGKDGNEEITKDYFIVFETLFHHNYPSETFINGAPDQDIYLGEFSFTGPIPFLYFEFFLSSKRNNNPVIGIHMNAELKSDGEIELSRDFQHSISDPKDLKKYHISDWRKMLEEVTNHIENVFNKDN